MRELKGNLFYKGQFQTGVVKIDGDIITDVQLCDSAAFSDSEKERLIIPGLIDIHMHGAVSVDACSAGVQDINKIIEYENKHGITGLCLATMTIPLEEIERAVETIGSINNISLYGIYLEGPFISDKKCGAQDSSNVALPDVQIIKKLVELSGGKIKKVLIAPELPGALEAVTELKSLSFSIGHSDAKYDEAVCAFNSGVGQVTHLYNAMAPYTHREPGIIGAAMDRDDIMVELIADGVHVHPAVVRNTFKSFGRDRVILISDSMEGTGMPDGRYVLGDSGVIKKGREAVLAEDGRTLAGSVSNLYDCLVSAIKMGVPAHDAIYAATYNPAKAIGLEDKVGDIETGKMANLLILDRDYSIIKVVMGE